MSGLDTTLVEKLELRPLSRNDLDAFWMWASDDDVTKWLMWDSYYSLSDAESFLVQVAKQHPCFQAICYAGTVVGSITLEQGKGHRSCVAELGYVVAKKSWGKGIATRAIQQAMQIAFKQLGVHRIEAFVSPDNHASRKALIKAGFECEGHLKNYLLHKGVLRDRLLFAATPSGK